MDDATQAYVDMIVIALEKIMGGEDDASRNHALKLIGRRLVILGNEAALDALELLGVPALGSA